MLLEDPSGSLTTFNILESESARAVVDRIRKDKENARRK